MSDKQSAARRAALARARDFMIYHMALNEEVRTGGWQMQVGRQALADALAPMRGLVTLVVGDGGISLRGRMATGGTSICEIAGRGIWASPISTEAARMRQALRALTWDEVDLAWCEGRLRLDQRSVAGREV